MGLFSFVGSISSWVHFLLFSRAKSPSNWIWVWLNISHALLPCVHYLVVCDFLWPSELHHSLKNMLLKQVSCLNVSSSNSNKEVRSAFTLSGRWCWRVRTATTNLVKWSIFWIVERKKIDTQYFQWGKLVPSHKGNSGISTLWHWTDHTVMTDLFNQPEQTHIQLVSWTKLTLMDTPVSCFHEGLSPSYSMTCQVTDES